MIFQRKISNTLDSLMSGTSLTIAGSDWTVRLNGLNSPYESHKSCELSSKGHGICGVVEVANRFNTIWFDFSFGKLPAMKGDFMAGEIWTSRLVDLLHRDGIFCSLPIKLDWELPRLATVAIPDTFRGFDDCGQPQFDPAWEVGFELNFDGDPKHHRRNTACLIGWDDWPGREIWVERNQGELWFSLDLNPSDDADPSSVIEMKLGDFSECSALWEILDPNHPALQTLQRRGFNIEPDAMENVRFIRRSDDE